MVFVDPGTMTNTGSVGISVTLDGGSYLNNTSTGVINVAGTAVYGTTNGADTVPRLTPRTEYALAIVWSRAFWL